MTAPTGCPIILNVVQNMMLPAIPLILSFSWIMMINNEVNIPKKPAPVIYPNKTANTYSCIIPERVKTITMLIIAETLLLLNGEYTCLLKKLWTRKFQSLQYYAIVVEFHHSV